MESGIYLIQVGDRKYVGQSINIKTRFTSHKWYLNNNNHKNSIMQNLWNKYKDKFEFLVLEECDESILNLRESFWIDKLNTFNDKNPKGMNINGGGDSRRHSEKSKKKMSLSQMGKPVSLEARRKISDAKKGKPSTRKGKTQLQTRAENNPNSKLSWNDVNEIRKLHSKGIYKSEQLGEMFGCGKSHIWRIVTNQTWVI